MKISPVYAKIGHKISSKICYNMYEQSIIISLLLVYKTRIDGFVQKDELTAKTLH